jgi:hypothetical protein
MKVNRWLATAGVAAALGLGINSGLAQNGGGGGGGGGWRNMTPEERQQRMMGFVKETLEVTDDAEWKEIQPRVQKVMDARMGMMGGGGMGRMFARNRGGGNGGDNQGGDQGGQRRNFFGQAPSPETEALQKAIDAKAPKAELKAALAKYEEAHKAKQAELEKAQAELRKVLTTRQEAIATLNGWL